jgi:hypothetical protein
MVDSTRLKLLLRQRHWQPYRTFCLEYDKAARAVDANLVGTWPSRTQFNRWLAGDVKNLPYPDHCRVLEKMFTGVGAEDLFGPPRGESSINSVSSEGLLRTDSPAEYDLAGQMFPVAQAQGDASQVAVLPHTTSSNSGTQKFYQDFVDIERDWEPLFGSSSTLDLAMMYGSTWRNTYHKQLRTLARRPSGRIRVVLPHCSEDSPLVSLYAGTLGVTHDEFRGKVREAVADFRSIEPQHHVEIYFTNTAFRHAIYMFAEYAILALYALCSERISTPALLVSSGGLLNFLRLDFDHLLRQSDREF